MSSYERIVAMWRGYNVKSEADVDLRLHSFRILFAYHSGKIENDRITYHDTREIFENGRILNYTGDYVIGREEVGSLPGDVEADLKDLLAELQEHGESDTLKAAAYFHARFEYIHPFADGNGRVGRTLMNYFLILRGHPPIIVFDERKREYYAALERYDRSEDLEPVYVFLRNEACATWEKALARGN